MALRKNEWVSKNGLNIVGVGAVIVADLVEVGDKGGECFDNQKLVRWILDGLRM